MPREADGYFQRSPSSSQTGALKPVADDENFDVCVFRRTLIVSGLCSGKMAWIDSGKTLRTLSHIPLFCLKPILGIQMLGDTGQTVFLITITNGSMLISNITKKSNTMLQEGDFFFLMVENWEEGTRDEGQGTRDKWV